MRRISVLIIVLGLVSISSRSSQAQVRGVGAGSFVMDDYNGHTITLLAPTSVGPSLAEWNAWQLVPVANLNWFAAPPPVNNAQAGFILSGPLAGGIVPEFAYWLPPGQGSVRGGGVTGGSAGTYDHATLAQLGAGAGAFPPAYLNAYLYTLAPQAVAAGIAVTFNNNPQNAGFTWNGTTTFTVNAGNGGTYLVQWSVEPPNASDWAITVNGVIAQGTAFGCATATTVINGTAILTLAAGDVLQLVDELGPQLLIAHSGISNSASLTAVRIR